MNEDLTLAQVQTAEIIKCLNLIVKELQQINTNLIRIDDTILVNI